MTRHKSSGNRKRRREEAEKYYKNLTEEDFEFAKAQLRRKDLFNATLPRLEREERAQAKHIIKQSVNAIFKRTGLRNQFTYFCRQFSDTWDGPSFKKWLEEQILEIGTTRPSKARISQIFATVAEGKEEAKEGLELMTEEPAVECFEIESKMEENQLEMEE